MLVRWGFQSGIGTYAVALLSIHAKMHGETRSSSFRSYYSFLLSLGLA